MKKQLIKALTTKHYRDAIIIIERINNKADGTPRYHVFVSYEYFEGGNAGSYSLNMEGYYMTETDLAKKAYEEVDKWLGI